MYKHMTNELQEDILVRYSYMDTDNFSLSALAWTIASDIGCEYDDVMDAIVSEYGVFDE